MAGRADDGRMMGLMAVYAGLHPHAQLSLDDVIHPDIAMAGGAGNLLRLVPGVAEENEVGQLVHRLFRHDERIRGKGCQTPDSLSVLRYLTMAHQTFRRRRKGGPLGDERLGMAVHALDLQAGVTLVAKRQRLIGPKQLRQGKEYATKESEKSLLYLLPPPAEITTNCLPDFLPRNVIGVA